MLLLFSLCKNAHEQRRAHSFTICIAVQEEFMSGAALEVRDEREGEGEKGDKERERWHTTNKKTPSCNKKQKDFPLAQLAFSI